MGRKCKKKKNKLRKVFHVFIHKNHLTPNKDFAVSFFLSIFAN